MDFLALAQRLRQEANVSGPGTPATVVNQRGISKTLVDWISQAWIEIQESRDNWEWLWREFTFDTTADIRDYDPVADIGLSTFSRWDTNAFRIYLTSDGAAAEGRLRYIEYPKWRSIYRRGMTAVESNAPVRCTVLPDEKLRIDPAPNGIYTVSGEYYVVPVQLVANTDTPAIPPEYHMAIVYKALQYYASFYESPSLYNSAVVNYDRIMRPLLRKKLPQFDIAGPLA